MSENSNELTKPTKHPEQVKAYMEKGYAEEAARSETSKDLRIGRLRDAKKKAEQTAQNATEIAKKASEESLLDPLTGIYNRRWLFGDEHNPGEFDRLLADAIREHHGLTAMVIDADDFKTVNDKYGHETGDQVLKSIAGTIRKKLRTSDHVARIGGEEFIALLPGTHKLMPKELTNLIGRFQYEFQEAEEGLPPHLRRTISIGVASYSPKDGTKISARDLYTRADDAMYRAKTNGKNRFVMWDPSIPPKAQQEAQIKSVNSPK